MINFKFFHEENETVKEAEKSLGFSNKDSFSFTEKHKWYLLIFYKDVVIGMASFIEVDPETWEIINLKVRDKLEHQKIGTYLLKFSETKIKELGGRWMICYIPLSLKPFFLKNHFHVSDNGEISENDGVLLVKMAKFLYPKTYKSRTKY